MQWHPLAAAAVSTFLPLLLLGTVLLQAIRSAAKEIGTVGASAGRVSALSTVGSIACVLLTVMYLFGKLGVLNTLYATSGALVVIGVLGIVSCRKAGIGAAAAFVLAFQFSADAQERLMGRRCTRCTARLSPHHRSRRRGGVRAVVRRGGREHDGFARSPARGIRLHRVFPRGQAAQSANEQGILHRLGRRYGAEKFFSQLSRHANRSGGVGSRRATGSAPVFLSAEGPALAGKAWPAGPFLEHPLSAREMADWGDGMDSEFLAGLRGFARALPTDYERAPRWDCFDG